MDWLGLSIGRWDEYEIPFIRDFLQILRPNMAMISHSSAAVSRSFGRVLFDLTFQFGLFARRITLQSTELTKLPQRCLKYQPFTTNLSISAYTCVWEIRLYGEYVVLLSGRCSLL